MSALAELASDVDDRTRLFKAMGESTLSEVRLQRLVAAGRDLVSELDLETILARVLEAAREVTGARYAALGILNPEKTSLERFLTIGIDEQLRASLGDPPSGKGVLGLLIKDPRPLMLENVGDHQDSYGFPAGHPPMQTFVGVPIRVRGEVYGNLYLTEKQDGHFDDSDQEAAVLLAGWAAIAIGNARSVAEHRLRGSIRAADRERGRWARELHDETLQGLGALRLMLSTALRRGTEQGLQAACAEAVEQLQTEIANLRSLITELRPAALDELGLHAAIEGLVERSATRDGLEVDAAIELGPTGALDPELQTTVYRIVQEALSNVSRHSRAERVALEIRRLGKDLAIDIRDDGVGFDPDRVASGFGLTGMRERVLLAGGRIEVEASTGTGTGISVRLPPNGGVIAPPGYGS